MVLETLKSKLQEIDQLVYYGMASDALLEEDWNYIVFNRKVKSVAAGNTGYTDYFTVSIIRENFIPEGIEERMIAKVLEIPGFKTTKEPGEYNYTKKPNTDMVVEMFSMDFLYSKKR